MKKYIVLIVFFLITLFTININSNITAKIAVVGERDPYLYTIINNEYIIVETGPNLDLDDLKFETPEWATDEPGWEIESEKVLITNKEKKEIKQLIKNVKSSSHKGEKLYCAGGQWIEAIIGGKRYYSFVVTDIEHLERSGINKKHLHYDLLKLTAKLMKLTNTK